MTDSFLAYAAKKTGYSPEKLTEIVSSDPYGFFLGVDNLDDDLLKCWPELSQDARLILVVYGDHLDSEAWSSRGAEE